MCLDRKIRSKERKYFRYKKEDGYSVGYKVYTKSRKKGFMSTLNFGKNQPVGRWINEKQYRQNKDINSIFYFYGHNKHYPTGFHFFATKKDAEKECNSHSWKKMIIKKVYFMKACTRGIQDYKAVVVAKDIFIDPY
jgi:hypothetical protein